MLTGDEVRIVEFGVPAALNANELNCAPQRQNNSRNGAQLTLIH
jgi:hypothetical protein